jgi:membrane associated rhomboid family serine protease
MLEDRHYMRSPSFRPQRSGMVMLLIVNVVIFAVQEINAFYVGLPFEKYLALSSHGLLKGYVWQLLTFQFLHADLFHLLFNCLTIFFFGRFVEDALGRRTFFKIYFLSGTLGGLVQVLLGAIWPNHFGLAVMGASAGGLGLLAAFARLDPEQAILIWFVLPVKAKHFLWVAAVIAGFYVLVPARTGIAHAAHLGGILGGWAYVHFAVRKAGWPFSLSKFRPTRPRPRELVRTASSKRPLWQRPKDSAPDDLPPGEFISREVDPILDKISAHGIQSLTERERKILEAARSKMAKR